MREVYMDGFIIRNILIKLIRILDRTILNTGGTTGTFVFNNISGLFLIRVTLKSPASPSTLSTSVNVRISIFGCRPTSTSLGERIHIEQSLVGKVLSSWAIWPPMLGPFSTR